MKKLIIGILSISAFALAENPQPVNQPPINQMQKIQETQPPEKPIDIKLSPEDEKIIKLKKKMTERKLYNDYQKVEKATNIDKLNLMLNEIQTKNAIKSEIRKAKLLERPVEEIKVKVSGVVGSVAITDTIAIKDGDLVRDKQVVIRDGMVYIDGINTVINYTATKDDANVSASSGSVNLLTGLPNGQTGQMPPPLPPSLSTPPNLR